MSMTIMYPQKSRNVKMCNLLSNGIIRFKEEDILKVIPNYFKNDSKRLLLDDKQLMSIANGRSVERYSNDNEFGDFEKDFALYQLHNKDKYKQRRHGNGNGKYGTNGRSNGKNGKHPKLHRKNHHK